MADPWFHSNGPLWTFAVVSGLIVMMLVAVLGPRLFAAEEPAWIVSIIAGVVVAIAIVAFGYAKRNTGRVEQHPHEE